MFKSQKLWRLLTIAALLASSLNLSLVSSTSVQALSTSIVISQVYGGGGSSSGTPAYKNDYVELFNRGTAAIDINGWSLQYGAAGTTSLFGGSSGASIVAFTTSTIIAPGSYYMVQLGSAGSAGSNFPVTPDLTSTTISMSGTGGKIALASNNTWLNCSPVTSCLIAGKPIVDAVAYGATSNGGEGDTSVNNNVNVNTAQGAVRKSNGCTETDNNNADFDVVAPPIPRNSTSSTNACSPVMPTVNLSVSANASSASEAAMTEITITATANSTVTGDQTVNLGVSGSGITLSDYSLSDTKITIPGGGTTGFVTFTVADDSDYEGIETATLTISDPSNGIVLGTTTTQNIAITDNDPPPFPAVSISVSASSGTEAGATEITVTATASSNVSGAQTVSLVVTGTGITTDDYTLSSSTITIPDASDHASVTFTVVNDTEVEGNETATLAISNPVGDGIVLGTPTTQDVTIIDNDTICNTTPIPNPIPTIQGSGMTAAITGAVTTQGIVVGDFEGASPNLGGFYIQDPTDDADLSTSNGIFVYYNTGNLVAEGDLVRVTGYARERFEQTTLNGSNSNSAPVLAGNVTVCSHGNPLPDAVDISFPVASNTYLERFEGMRVNLPQQLTISEYYGYAQYGEIVIGYPNGLTELGGQDRFFTPTNIVEPGTAATALANSYALRQITLDDALSVSNPTSLRHPNGNPFSLTNTFRGGDKVQNVIGVLGYDFSKYRIQPTGPATFTAANVRASSPEDVGGRIKVASFNTLNYFLTADYPTGNPLDNKCGPLQNVECRGWDSDQTDELTRQRTKLLQAIKGIDADVIGLNELENTYGVEPAADIVAGLNALYGSTIYAYIDTGLIGTDAIRIGMIYKPAKVTPVGLFAILDSTVDPRFVDSKNRPALAQTFEENTTGERFTVISNHLKSKGSTCNTATNNTDDDLTVGGQGNCNGTRTNAAKALVDWAATDPTGSGDPDFLIIGDLNSYAKEDPIDAILAGADDIASTTDDWTNLTAKYRGLFAYSYVYDGQIGYLDHALANAPLTSQVTGAAEWHINADEPGVLDYDTTYKPASQDALYEPNAFRTSDHDPVIIGLDLDADSPVLTITGFAADGIAMSAENGSYVLPTTNVATTNHEIKFRAGSISSEPLIGKVGLYLNPAGVDVAGLEAYYRARIADDSPARPYRDYLISALDGHTKPFAYVATDASNNLVLHDAAQYDLANNLTVGMVIPDNYPMGIYPVSGVAKDVNGNSAPISLSLRVGPAYILQILHASDWEAGLAAIQDAPNFAAVVDYFDNSYSNTLILSSGDNYIPGTFFNAGGDPALATLLGVPSVGRADIEILNRIGVEASAFGNHDFDAGTKEVSNIIATATSGTAFWRGAQFPYLSSNLNFSTDANLLSLTRAGGYDARTIKGKVAPSAILTKGGQKIGLVGITTPLLANISSPGSVGVNPANPEDMSALAAIVQPAINALVAQGANKIIVLAHMQQVSYEEALAPLLHGVDVIIAGGSNTLLADTDDRLRSGDVAADTYPLSLTNADSKPVLVVNTDGSYRYVGRLVIGFDAAGNLLPASYVSAESGAYATDSQGVEDLWGNLTAPFAAGTKGALVKQITDAAAGVINAKDGVIYGHTNVYLNGLRAEIRTEETNLGNMTADANLAEAQNYQGQHQGTETLPVMISIKNGGGLRDSIGSTEDILDADGNVTGVSRVKTVANPSAGKNAGDISKLDVENSLRFNNDLSMITVSAANLKRILEHAVAASASGLTPGQFPQIGGIAFSYDLNQQKQVITAGTGGVATVTTEGSRIRNVALINENGQVIEKIVENGSVVDNPARLFRLVTLRYMVDDGSNNDGLGGDNYPFPTFCINRVDLGIYEQDAFKNYLLAKYPLSNPAYNTADTPALLDTRIQNLQIRSDAIFPVYTISGNVGVDGATINYTGGTPVTVDNSGDYSISVPVNWSGTVTPSKTGYIFTPANISYTNVAENQTSQDYTAFLGANVDIYVGSGVSPQGTYPLKAGEAKRLSYDLSGGPVKVESTNGAEIVAAIRLQSMQGGTLLDYNETVGLPDGLLSTKYYFPAYENKWAPLNSQIRIAHFGTGTKKIKVTIGTRVYSYDVEEGKDKRISLSESGGPVIVESEDGVTKIIAAIRLQCMSNGVLNCYSETLGIPGEKLSHKYYFPVYENKWAPLNSQIRFAHLGTGMKWIKVTIGTEVVFHEEVDAGVDKRISLDKSGGPVIVESDDGVTPIIAAIRLQSMQGGTLLDYNETMGIPEGLLSTKYYFSVYENKWTPLNSQIRFAHLGTGAKTIKVTIGTEVLTYNVDQGKDMRISLDRSGGPVIIESLDGVTPIIAAIRLQGISDGILNFYSETSGIPFEYLAEKYYFPVYENKWALLDSQVRFGVP